MSCGPSWWVLYSSLSAAVQVTLSSEQQPRLKKGLCSVAVSVRELQPAQDFGLKLLVGISQNKPTVVSQCQLDCTHVEVIRTAWPASIS